MHKTLPWNAQGLQNLTTDIAFKQDFTVQLNSKKTHFKRPIGRLYTVQSRASLPTISTLNPHLHQENIVHVQPSFCFWWVLAYSFSTSRPSKL